jgi:hypothetical protein
MKRNRKRAPRTSRQEQLLTETCCLALNLVKTLLRQSARSASMPLNSQPSTINLSMNPDNFEPSQDENLPSLQAVLKTAEDHASIDQDLQDSLNLDPSTLNAQPSTHLSPAKGESEAAWTAFLTFLDLAPKGATNADVAKATETSTSTIKYWSSRFRWRQRLHHLNAQAMESRVTAQKQEQVKTGIDWAKRAQEQAELEWALTSKLLETARQSLDDLALSPEPTNLNHATTAIQTGTKIQRQAIDRATNKTEATAQDTNALRQQLLANAKKAYAKHKQPKAS